MHLSREQKGDLRDLLRKRHKLVARRAVEYFALRKLISNSIVAHKLAIAAYHEETGTISGGTDVPGISGGIRNGESGHPRA